MSLTPRKVTKLSFANNHVTKQDSISDLPDELLTHILSLLPDADACRTSVLSKRWKTLWIFLPNLHFVIPNSSRREQTSEYYNLVQKNLALRDGLPIQRFFLYSPRMYDNLFIGDWLRIAGQHKVQILELRSPPRHMFVVRCYADMFKTCHKLAELTLEGQFSVHMPKDVVLFPCLKKVSLVSIQYGGDESFKNLITSCCPALQELNLERQKCDNLETINIISISLKRLRIYNAADVYEGRFVIDTPNLEYLYIEDKKESGCLDYYFMNEPSSLVEAYIDTDTESINEIFSSISVVKVLTLTSETIRGFNEVNEIDEFVEFDGRNVPRFPNLAKLVIDMNDIPNWSFFFVFLDNMPNLEHITFSNGFLLSHVARRMVHAYWKPPLEAPTCLRIKVKEITILNQEAITEEELPIIWYLLNQSNNLEILRVNGRVAIKSSFCQATRAQARAWLNQAKLLLSSSPKIV